MAKFDPKQTRVISVKAARAYLKGIGIRAVGAPVQNGVNIIKFNVQGDPLEIFKLLDSFNPADEDCHKFVQTIYAGQGYSTKFTKRALNGFWNDTRGMRSMKCAREIHLEHTSAKTCTIALSHADL